MNIKVFDIFCVLFSLLSGESPGQIVYGKTGENVYLHLRHSHRRSSTDIQWRRQNILIAKTTGSMHQFAEVLRNGTLKLYNVGRNCSGKYTVNAFDDQGVVNLNESYDLVVIDPPVVELLACMLEVSVLHCAGENGPDAEYDWWVSVLNQGHRKVSNYTGKYLALNYSTGNICCSLKKGNYSSQSEPYHLSCAGESPGQIVYGKTGENVYLHLRHSHGRSSTDIRWIRQNILIAKTTGSMHQFAEVLSNGTLKLYNVGRKCSGKYTVRAFDDQGVMTLNESYDLVVIDPPVVELVACTLEVSVLHCAGENGPDAKYDWRVSVLNQRHRKVSNYTGKYLALNYSTGNICCSLKKGNYSSQSEPYHLSCAEMKLYVRVEVTVLLGLLCFLTCGISVGVQICRKKQNSNVKSEGHCPSLELTRDDGVMTTIVYIEVGKEHKPLFHPFS